MLPHFVFLGTPRVLPSWSGDQLPGRRRGLHGRPLAREIASEIGGWVLCLGPPAIGARALTVSFLVGRVPLLK